MQINKTNSQNFKGVYIHKTMLPTLMVQSEDYYKHSQQDKKILEDKIDKCKKTKHSDVFITKYGEVYAKDRKYKRRIFTAMDKPLFYQYYMALTKALILDECYKKGKDPYDFDILN